MKKKKFYIAPDAELTFLDPADIIQSSTTDNFDEDYEDNIDIGDLLP